MPILILGGDPTWCRLSGEPSAPLLLGLRPHDRSEPDRAERPEA